MGNLFFDEPGVKNKPRREPRAGDVWESMSTRYQYIIIKVADGKTVYKPADSTNGLTSIVPIGAWAGGFKLVSEVPDGQPVL